jgi:hypothetical protein
VLAGPYPLAPRRAWPQTHRVNLPIRYARNGELFVAYTSEGSARVDGDAVAGLAVRSGAGEAPNS